MENFTYIGFARSRCDDKVLDLFSIMNDQKEVGESTGLIRKIIFIKIIKVCF